MSMKSERGAIVIEAVISLMTFMFAMSTLYCLYFPCVAQARIGAALNSAAKEISQYSYLYGLTNLNEKQSGLVQGTGAAQSTLEANFGQIDDFYSVLEGLGDTISDIGVNGESYINYVGNQFIEDVKGKAVGALAESLMKKNFGGDPDGFLKGLGIVGGMSGLDTSKSRVFANGDSDDITLVCKYEVKVIQLFNIDVKFTFEQCAATKAWFGGVD